MGKRGKGQHNAIVLPIGPSLIAFPSPSSTRPYVHTSISFPDTPPPIHPGKMKKINGTTLAGVLLLAGLFVMTACSGSGETTTDKRDPNTVTREDAERNPTIRLSDLIVQRVAGITVTESGDGRIKVRVRGVTSFTADNQPLYVVDDIPVDPEPDGSLPGVTLSDIEEIRIFKNPADTSRWGMRGSNGVIVVKTKMGR